MTPRTKQYESEAEKQKAYRERKRGLRQKLSELITGNHALQPENESLQPETTEPTKVVRVIMDTNSNEGSVSQANRVLRGTCEWCNILIGHQEGLVGKCGFCQKYQSKEESRFARQLLGNLSLLRNSHGKTELDRIFNEELAKFRSGNPTKIERHKLN